MALLVPLLLELLAWVQFRLAYTGRALKVLSSYLSDRKPSLRIKEIVESVMGVSLSLMGRMKPIFKRILATKTENDAIVTVSGLPRCGTSMMMQMLEAGGIHTITDEIRKADEDNPRGYYELEKVKEIKKDASWIKNCRGKAFKMVSALLYYLPQDENYKVIFMKRDMKEVLASQNAMLQRLGRNTCDHGDAEMLGQFEEHIRLVEKWLERQKNMEVIYIRYNEVIQNPHECARLISRFLGDNLNTNRMAGVVDKSLYRKRKK